MEYLAFVRVCVHVCIHKYTLIMPFLLKVVIFYCHVELGERTT